MAGFGWPSMAGFEVATEAKQKIVGKIRGVPDVIRLRKLNIRAGRVCLNQ
jgi:hypothetical protein